MATNEGWPEAFGFALSHGSPCVVSWVEEGGSAQRAGLQCGDVLVQVDEEDVREWSVVDVIERARIAKKVPPSLLVKSAILYVSLPRVSSSEGFGITFRGDSPVYVRSVDFNSAGWEAGVRSGDLLLEVNSINVRYSSKSEVLQLLKETGGVLTLTIVKGGLQNETVPSSGDHLGITKNKSKLFNDKVNYFLQHDNHKRVQLLAILKVYKADRDVENLGTSVDVLLETPIERRLLRDIRGFLLPNHLLRFDALVSFEPNRGLSQIHRGLSPSPLIGRSMTRSGKSGSLPNIYDESSTRSVVVSRDTNGGYGFSLSGNAPVFIRSVDTASPAAIAGLNPMDYILEINSVDVRSATHSHVLRLLSKGGAKPHLLVSQRPPIWDSSGHEGTDGNSVRLLPETKISENQSRVFRRKMNELLPKESRASVTSELKRYSQQRDLPELVDRLSSVITDKRQSVLFHYICQMLPEDTQTQFDNLAATKLAKTSKGRGRHHPISTLTTVSSTSQSHREDDYASSRGSQTSSDDDVSQFKTKKQHRSKDTRGDHEGEATGHREKSKSDKRRGHGKSRRKESSMATRPLPPIPTDSTSSSMSTTDTVREGASSYRKGVESDSHGTLSSTPVGGGKSVSTTPNLSTVIPLPPPPPPPGAPLGGVGIPPPPAPPPPVAGPLVGNNRPKTKRVNWDKLQGQSLEGTIWRELSGLEEALEYCKLEEQFSTVSPKVPQGGTKEKKPSVLVPRKAYNIAILMGHLKMSTKQIKDAVLSCNTEVLSEARLSQMEAFAPDKRECLAYARYIQDSSVLGPADQFSCEMSTIPYYTERLRSMIYMSHFEERYTEIKSDLQTIVTASLSLQNSKKLKKILEIVLKIGNFLNVGAGQSPTAAQGFRIHFLSQLKDLKTTDNKSTLIHYLYTVAEQKYPQVLNFPGELAAVRNAARVSGETLELEVSEAKAGLMEVKNTLSDIAIIEDRLPMDRFVEVVTPFMLDSESKLSELVKLYSEMRVHYNRVAKFFSENPSITQIDEFFGAFATFLTDFERVEREIRDTRERQIQRERQMEERSRWSIRRGSNTPLADDEQVVDLRGELARRVAIRNSQVATGEDTSPQPSQYPPTVEYDRETFF